MSTYFPLSSSVYIDLSYSVEIISSKVDNEIRCDFQRLSFFIDFDYLFRKRKLSLDSADGVEHNSDIEWYVFLSIYLALLTTIYLSV